MKTNKTWMQRKMIKRKSENSRSGPAAGPGCRLLAAGPVAFSIREKRVPPGVVQPDADGTRLTDATWPYNVAGNPLGSDPMMP